MSDNHKNHIRELFKDIKLLIIDEFGMTGRLKLRQISEYLKQVFDQDSTFGHISVIMAGDFNQLKPIGDVVLYK